MKTSTIITWVVVLAAVVLGGWYFYSMQNAPVTPSEQTQTTQNPQDQDSDTTPGTGVGVDVGASVDIISSPMLATITLSSSGFSPASITIAKGGTITWTNQSGSPMWVASAMHPTHVVYDNTDLEKHCAAGYTGPTPFDQCKPGTTYSFTFNEVGTWGYHNHSNASQFGKIIVK